MGRGKDVALKALESAGREGRGRSAKEKREEKEQETTFLELLASNVFLARSNSKLSVAALVK